MLIREGDAQRSSMMQCKKRPGDVAIEPLVSFKKTVSMEKKKKWKWKTGYKMGKMQ